MLGLPVAASASSIAPVALSVAETAPPEGEQVTWGVRPADTAQGIDRPNYAYELAPGEQLDDAMIVSNYFDAPLTFRMYAADGFLTEDGQLDLLPADEESELLGSWVAFAEEQVTVEPGASATVPFALTVPDDVTPGDYAAGVVSSIVVESAEGVAVERRLGSRVHLRVTGDLAPAFSVDGLTVSFEGGLNPFAPGQATVDYTLINDGNVRLDVDPGLSVSGPFGLLAVDAPAASTELLPGDSVAQTVQLDGVWPLFVLLASAEASGAIISATGAASGAAEAVTATASGSAPALPWGALAILLLLAGLVALQIVRRRRRRRSEEQRIAEAVAAALESRAEESGDRHPEPVGAPSDR
ncbi:MAG: DUF916 domain-containing protein [Microbacteriaceae bacterium]